MEKLLKITEQLVKLDSISNDSAHGLREYKLEDGFAFSSTVYQSELVSMAIGFASKGATIPYHVHVDADELFVCYKGSLSFITDIERVRINAGDIYKIQKGVGHMFRLHEDTEMVIITIPPDFGAMARINDNGR